jgi:type I restriction enzyme S subunit
MGGRYQAYPEYKESGVEWLGKIPECWESIRLKHVAELEGDKVEPDSNSRYVGMENIESGNGKYVKKEDIKPEGLSKSFLNDDVLFGKLRPYLAKSWLADFSGICSSEFLILRSKKVSPRFLNYYTLTDEFINQVDSSTYGSKMPRASWCFIALMGVPVPIYDESTKIANFLDHETAKIDTLIEKQQQLIKLLKEKRQAVISHAVTKGINPDAPMRDSGVEWLGEVPEGWEVARLKYHTVLFEQGWSPQCDSRPADTGEYGVLKVGCVNGGIFNSIENKALPNELEPQLQYTIKKQDLLISRANTKELVGSAAVVDQDYDNLILCDKLYRLRFNEVVNSQIMAYYLSLPIVRQQIELEASGASHSMQNIGQSTIKELPVLLLPASEANELVLEIEKRVNIFELILSNVDKQIGLLQERRTALISAAVTGKINVRDWSGAHA